jgi:hypothetical protein
MGPLTNESEPASVDDFRRADWLGLGANFSVSIPVSNAAAAVMSECEDAGVEIRDWIATFASWKGRQKKLAYAIFLKLTAIGQIL